MGLFDFIKRKKNISQTSSLPPSFEQALKVLFPKGEVDHERQINEISAHFNKKYNNEEVNSNLIFILSGYLLMGKSLTRQSAINSVLTRPKNRMTYEEVAFVYDYAIENHPKLIQLKFAERIMDELSVDGCSSDTLPNGFGRFGFSETNPIPTQGVVGIYEYLDHLYDKNGNKVSATRVGTSYNDISMHPIDIYKISDSDISLYFSAYHKRNSHLSPSGYILTDVKNVILSNGGVTEYTTGCIFNPGETKVQYEEKSPSIKQPITSDNNSYLRSSTPCIDIYGTELSMRLSDIYSCINSAAEWMLKQMISLPSPSEEAQLEAEILLASVLSRNIKKFIVVQALVSNNPEFDKMDLTKLTEAIDGYVNQYNREYALDHLKKRVLLLDFAKENGKLKLITLPKEDKSGNLKAPAFCKDDMTPIICRFVFFDENEQTSEFIIKNKHDILVDITQENEYLFIHKREIEWSKNFFLKYILYYLYIQPLNYQWCLSSEEIDKAITELEVVKTNVFIAKDIDSIQQHVKGTKSNILPLTEYALLEGVRYLESLASSLGLIGKFN